MTYFFIVRTFVLWKNDIKIQQFPKFIKYVDCLFPNFNCAVVLNFKIKMCYGILNFRFASLLNNSKPSSFKNASLIRAYQCLKWLQNNVQIYFRMNYKGHIPAKQAKNTHNSYRWKILLLQEASKISVKRKGYWHFFLLIKYMYRISFE